jgi:DNA polymerase I-like protein with 3'-5' exonuclease and polymerase domains
MIVDSKKDYENFINSNINSDLIFECVGCDDRYHSVADRPCFVIVKNITNYKYYVISFEHPDSCFYVDLQIFCSDMQKMRGKKWVINKKKFLHYFNLENLLDVDLVYFLEHGEIIDYEMYESPVFNFYKRKYAKYADINCVIPLSSFIEKFDKYTDNIIKYLKKDNIESSYFNLNTHVIENLSVIEHNGLKVDIEIFNKFFSEKNVKVKDGFVYTEYNIFTSTGRPSNRYGGVNYAALKKDDGCRSSFVSRYQDGMLFMIDYSAYHPHLIAELIRYDLPIDTYNYLGKYYFNQDSLSEEKIKEAKNITFQLMYGNIPDKYKHIPYFKKIIEYIDHRWDYFVTFGYVETPIFKRRISTNNIHEPNPNKLFNYILQASETEYNMNIMSYVNSYLKDKKTKAILYTYDAVLFDLHSSDGENTMKELKKIMMNNKFPVKCYTGKNYNEMNVISI